MSQTDYLAALYFQYSNWKEMELEENVECNDIFINHMRGWIIIFSLYIDTTVYTLQRNEGVMRVIHVAEQTLKQWCTWKWESLNLRV